MIHNIVKDHQQIARSKRHHGYVDGLIMANGSSAMLKRRGAKASPCCTPVPAQYNAIGRGVQYCTFWYRPESKYMASISDTCAFKKNTYI